MNHVTEEQRLAQPKVYIRDQDQDMFTKDSGQDLSKQAEMNLFDFIENDRNAEFVAGVKAHGGFQPREDQLALSKVSNIGPLQSDVIDWMCRNPKLGQRKWYQEKGFTCEEAKPHMRWPGEIGYNEWNVGEYCFGIRGNSDDQLKEVFGGKAAFEKIGMDMDHCLARLLVYMPGNLIPLHLDNFVSFGETFHYLNCKILRGDGVKDRLAAGQDRWDLQQYSVCDLGRVGRRLITVSDWAWGQTLMFENTHIPRWKSGDVWNVPSSIYHVSGNAGPRLKMTCIFTGVLTD